MTRQPLIRDAIGVYHVTSRCNNREWFSLPLAFVWRLFEERLGPISERYRTEIHAFVLMTNHFHLVLSTPQLNLDAFMRDFMTAASRAIARSSRRINHVFGGRHRWSLVTNAFDASIVYKYVCRNPVRAGLCDAVEDYPYSTVQRMLHGECSIPVVDRTDRIWRFARASIEERLRWLNVPAPLELERLVGQGLRRFEFKFSESNSVRKQVERLKRTYGPEGTWHDRYLLGPEVE